MVNDICIVTTIHPENEKRIYQRCALVYSRGGYRTALIAPWKDLKPKEDVFLIQTNYPLTRIRRLLHGFVTFIICYINPSKIYHIHDIDFLPWAALLKYLRKCEVIYDCHENYPEEILYGKQWIPLKLRKIISSTTRLIENRLAQYVGNVVVVVPHQSARFNMLGCNVVLVRNFSDIEYAVPVLKDRTEVAYIGTISPTYGMETLINLLFLLKKDESKIILNIAGKFHDDETKARFYKSTVEYSGQFNMIENATIDEIIEIANRSAIGVSFEQPSPEKNLAYPAKLFEYMKFGFAIVSSNAETNKLIINKSKSGVICNYSSPQEYLDNIKHLLSNKNILEEYSVNAQIASNSEYSWNVEKSKLLLLANQLLDKVNYTENKGHF